MPGHQFDRDAPFLAILPTGADLAGEARAVKGLPLRSKGCGGRSA